MFKIQNGNTVQSVEALGGLRKRLPNNREKQWSIDKCPRRGGNMSFKTNVKIRISVMWLRFLLVYWRALRFAIK
jgi:hypothetical protein